MAARGRDRGGRTSWPPAVALTDKPAILTRSHLRLPMLGMSAARCSRSKAPPSPVACRTLIGGCDATRRCDRLRGRRNCDSMRRKVRRDMRHATGKTARHIRICREYISPFHRPPELAKSWWPRSRDEANRASWVHDWVRRSHPHARTPAISGLLALPATDLPIRFRDFRARPSHDQLAAAMTHKHANELTHALPLAPRHSGRRYAKRTSGSRRVTAWPSAWQKGFMRARSPRG